MIDRLCALADMPKPRVAIADNDMPNAFATGRNQKHAVLCVTTGIQRRLSLPELEAVLSHELSHVAHRDVAVMTIASFLGILAGMVVRSTIYAGAWGGGGWGRSNDRDNNAGAVIPLVVLASAVVYAVSSADPAAVALPGAPGRDRAGAILIGRPSPLASALVKITGDMGRIPTRDLRAAEPPPTPSPRRRRPGSASRRCSPPTRPWSGGWSSWSSWRPSWAGRREVPGRAAGAEQAQAAPAGRAVRGHRGGHRPGGGGRHEAHRPGRGLLQARLRAGVRGRLRGAQGPAGAGRAGGRVDAQGHRRPLRLPLGGAGRPGDGGPGDQRPPGQLDPGAVRLRAPAVLLGVRVLRSRGAALPPGVPLQRGTSTCSRRWVASAATTSWSCGSRPPWAATCRSSRSWPAGSPWGLPLD